MNKNLLSSTLLLIIMIGSLALAGTTRFNTVQASTEVIGILTSDTIWTRANSPYNLTGPTAVSEGVTLTIEAGATVNFNDYYIRVNGTLRARGSNTDKIYFNGGSDAWPNYAITFTSSSSDWNEQTGSGSIIENAILNSTRIFIDNASPKISDNSIIIVASMMESSDAIIINGGAPIISNNNIKGGISCSGSAVILCNTITGGMGIYSGSPIVAYNNISGGSTYFWIGRSQERNYNVVYIGDDCSAVVSNNNITGNGGGILFDAGEYHEKSIRYALLISGNTIYGCGAGISIASSIAGTLTIERNLISNNGSGISIRHDANLIIRSNTITENAKGISVEYLSDEGFSKEILNNNIYANKEYNFYLGSSSDINVTYNWWGTTDTQAINQTIYDSKYDFNLGTVTFIPFLTEPNPEAMPDPNAPIPTPAPEQTPTPTLEPTPTTSPTPTPEQTPTPTPSQEPTQTIPFEAILGAVIVVAVIVFSLGLLIYLIKRK